MVSLPHNEGVSGTDLPSQKENIDFIGCNTSDELACVLAASLLGGELSYYAAIGMHFTTNRINNIDDAANEEAYAFNM